MINLLLRGVWLEFVLVFGILLCIFEDIFLYYCEFYVNVKIYIIFNIFIIFEIKGIICNMIGMIGVVNF